MARNQRNRMRLLFVTVGVFACLALPLSQKSAGQSDDGVRRAEELTFIENGTMKIGVNRAMGAAITWLSWTTYPKNMINSVDPGRLIQQSYYAGKSLDRISEGQNKAWSPWPWNPIQGGGVGSWARVAELEVLDNQILFSETIPKLWDMPNEEANAVMRQWTSFEGSIPDVVTVKCELVCRREPEDRWGQVQRSPQEIPACYFTRNFQDIRSYLGNAKWRSEKQPPGPPWGKTDPPLKAMACFEPSGQGIAVFSPTSASTWNFGPHGFGSSDDPAAGPCVHVAPIDHVLLGPKSTFRYRYWLVVGTEKQIAPRLDALWLKYSGERAELSNP
jgi:hypothetical protein